MSETLGRVVYEAKSGVVMTFLTTLVEKLASTSGPNLGLGNWAYFIHKAARTVSFFATTNYTLLKGKKSKQFF